MSFQLPTDIDKRPIAVIGAGTLGRRIALMMATQGAEVRLHARTATTRDDGVAWAMALLPTQVARQEGGKPGRVVAAPELADALKGAWLVIESIPEQLELKLDMFARIDGLADADAILATNSSSYPSSELASSVSNPARLLNTHFMMPPDVIPVELMSCGRTDPAIIELLAERFPRYGLTPYVAQRESVGFIFNRIWAAIKRETLNVIAEGVATPEEVDAIYAQVLGIPAGPCRVMDKVGLDVVLDIEEHYAQVDPSLPEAPRSLLRQMLAEGRLGMKSGRGFYEYPQPPQ